MGLDNLFSEEQIQSFILYSGKKDKYGNLIEKQIFRNNRWWKKLGKETGVIAERNEN